MIETKLIEKTIEREAQEVKKLCEEVKKDVSQPIDIFAEVGKYFNFLN